MKSILNQLIQLQELNFAKEEQKASNSQMPLAQLEKSIAKIRGNCRPTWRSVRPIAEALSAGRNSAGPRELFALRPGVPANVVNAAKAASSCSIAHIVAAFYFSPTR